MPFLLRQVPRARLLRVGLLMAAVSASEGLGLFLLVPLVAAMSDGALPAPFARFADLAGLPLNAAALLAGFVVLVTLRALAQYALGLQALKLSTSVVDALRLRCTELLLGAPWRRLAAMRQSDNASLLIANIDRIDSGIRCLMGAAAASVTLAAAACAALVISPVLALAGALAGAVAILAYRGLRKRARLLGEELGHANDAVYARIDQTLGALRLIKTSLAERRVAEGVAQGFGALRTAELAWQRSFGRGQLALQVTAAASLAVMAWLAIDRLGLGAAVILPLIALFARTVPLLGALQENWQNWLHARPALADTARLIATLEPEVEASGSASCEPPGLSSAITLEAVTVLHQGRADAVLKNLSLTLPARQFLAITGASGSGKSTLADLLCGLIAPDQGEVRIDGTPLSSAERRAWRGAVAYVQQEPVLFHASIAENLTFARPEASEGEMRAALAAASAGFACGLPEGLGTIVGDRGTRLSGGERQRLSLARALLSRPQLLILDEPTSALDRANEEAIAEALRGLKGQLTIVAICHRGALTKLADRVVTLDDGRIISDLSQ